MQMIVYYKTFTVIGMVMVSGYILKLKLEIRILVYCVTFTHTVMGWKSNAALNSTIETCTFVYCITFAHPVICLILTLSYGHPSILLGFCKKKQYDLQ